MHCPRLFELPPPPEGKTGWPWTVETPPLPPTRPDGSPWPRISIVTPSYNQGQFIEETIRSVLLQGYPDLEYIIMDGGSTDGSVEVIRKYEPWLTYWISEQDRGQSHAINKGFTLISGRIMGWLNSDDLLRRGTLARVERAARESGAKWLTGICEVINPCGQAVGRLVPESGVSAIDWLKRLSAGKTQILPQPATFWTYQSWQRCGPLDVGLDYSFDHDYFLALFLGVGPPVVLSDVLSDFRVHASSKTSTRELDFKEENVRVFLHHMARLGSFDRIHACITAYRSLARFELFRWQVQGTIRGLVRVLVCNPMLALDTMFWGALRVALLAHRSA